MIVRVVRIKCLLAYITMTDVAPALEKTDPSAPDLPAAWIVVDDDDVKPATPTPAYAVRRGSLDRAVGRAGHEVARRLTGVVRTHPLASVAVAAGAGLAAGYALFGSPCAAAGMLVYASVRPELTVHRHYDGRRSKDVPEDR